MKRFFTLFTLLAALLCSTNTFAYDIWVGGVEVTEANKSDIRPAGWAGGKITYESGTLRFTDVTMNTDKSCITIKQAGVTVFFVGTNNLTTTGNANVIWATEPFTMDGPFHATTPAVVNLTNSTSSSGYCGIYAAFGGELNIWNIYLNISATNSAIVGNTDSTTKLYTSCAEINAKAGSDDAIRRFASWARSDYGIFTDGCTFSTSNKRVEDASGNGAKKVLLKNGLYVGKTLIRASATSSSPWDIKAAGLTSGSITYTNKTLTLDNTKMELTSEYLIQNRNVDGLRIVIKGSGTLKNTVMGMPLYANTTIEGYDAEKYNDNFLIVNGGASYPGIHCYDCDLTIKNANLWVSAQRAIEGENGHTITLDKACGILSKPEAASNPRVLSGFSTCNLLNNTDFVYSYYSTSQRALIGADGKPATSLIYAPYTTTYPIWILGHQLNDVNAPLGFACEGTLGKIEYNTTDKTLTLEDATIEGASSNDVYGIRSQVEGLKIQLNGSRNTITSDKSAIYVEAATEITGSALLAATSTKSSGLSVYGNTPVTINTNNEVHFEGEEYGYWGHHSDTNTECNLILTKAGDDSDYYFKGKMASVYQASHILCNDMDYYYSSSYGTPGCYFDVSDKYVKQNGGTIVKESDVNFYAVKEKYGIIINGIEVNNCNRRAIGSPYIKSDPLSVSYDDSSNQLLLNNAKIANPLHGNTIVIEKNTTIRVEGENLLETIENAFNGIVLNADNINVTIEGDGLLTVKAQNYGLMPWGSSCCLTIQDQVQIDATGGDQGIGSNNYGGFNEQLVIAGKAIVKASSIGGLGALTLKDGLRVAAPAGAEVKKVDGKGYGVYVGNDFAKNVYIGQVINYGLRFNHNGTNLEVTNANANDVFGDGKVSYDASSKTLTLDNATLYGYISNLKVEDLKINIVGTCVSDLVDNNNALYLNAPTSVIGTGTWNISLPNTSTTSVFYIVTPDGGETKAELTIDGPDVNISSGNNTCFRGYNSDTKLSILSGTIHYEGTGYPIDYVQTVTLGDGMYITEPAGATLTDNVILFNGSRYKGSFTISSAAPAMTYDLTIAGVTATSANCDDILGDGVYKYDDASKTLTIKGGTIEYTTNTLIRSEIDGLEIHFESPTTINYQSDHWHVMELYANTKIVNSTLKIVGNNSYSAIMAKNANLTIENSNIEISGFSWGISANLNEDLVIKTSDVSVTGKENADGAICAWKNITLEDCYVDEPRPSMIVNGNICDESYNRAKKVVIKKGTDAINGIDQAKTGATDIYDVSGRKLDQTRRGVNIVRTADGKVQKIAKK